MEASKGTKVFWPEDTALVVYLAMVAVAVAFFHKGVASWGLIVFLHAAGAFLTVAWVRFASPRVQSGSARPTVRVLRYFYIPILYTVLYESVDSFLLGLHGRYLDELVYRFEFNLVGFYPNIALDRLASPVLTEVMKIAYNSYYWLIPVLAFSLYLRGEFIAFRRTVFTVSVAFFISYFGFFLFPVEGPRYALAHLYKGPLEGYLVTALQDVIMRLGSIRGGCMPSSHVAVAFVVLLLAWIYRRRLAVVLTPAVTLLAISTVYNRYHYASDVAAGIVVGVFAFWWGGRVYGRNSGNAGGEPFQNPADGTGARPDSPCARPDEADPATKG